MSIPAPVVKAAVEDGVPVGSSGKEEPVGSSPWAMRFLQQAAAEGAPVEIDSLH